MLEKDQSPRVTVEDLLRLKRAERPSPEFWASFEAELRQKQLAALLEKRPWWQTLSRRALRHAYLPVSAAAAIAVAFVATNRFSESPAGSVEPVTPVRQSLDLAAVTPVSDEADNDFTAPVLDAKTERVAQAVEASDQIPVATTVPGDVAELIPWSAPRPEPSPSARSIAATLSRLEQSEPELFENRLMSRPVASPGFQPAAKRAALELASVTVAPARQSNRLLAGYQEREFIPDATVPDRVRERISRRLAEADLLDEIRRLDLKGDRVSLKL
jgi:hypothetical protein